MNVMRRAQKSISIRGARGRQTCVELSVLLATRLGSARHSKTKKYAETSSSRSTAGQ